MQGDFHHWLDLFNHFETYFEKYIKPRKDLQLEDDFLEHDPPPFPREAVLQILRVVRIILENCTNKHGYSSYEVKFCELMFVELRNILNNNQYERTTYTPWIEVKSLRKSNEVENKSEQLNTNI